MELAGKKVILGVCGSIAAYKAVYLLRLLIKEGAEVQVIMTPAAREFVGPVTFSALSGSAVLSDFFAEEGGDWNSHVEMGVSAGLMLIAPATATTLGKMAGGIADNLLVTTYLSARCPVVVAPAMDMDMFAHPSTRDNLATLVKRGNFVIYPGKGELASGLEGRGRMEEPDAVIDYLKRMDTVPSKKKLLNKRVLVTAGPTQESIDPVRYIGNHSSGKMGYAIAGAFAARGANVILISGPVSLELENKNVKLINVLSAKEMFDACEKHINEMDIAVFSAAVGDFTPRHVLRSKMKRGQENLVLELAPTKDIAGELGRNKKEGQFFVGFALETNNALENARSKMKKKNLDLIVLNSLEDDGAGFGFDTNKVSMATPGGDIEIYPLKSKIELASDLVDKVIKMTSHA